MEITGIQPILAMLASLIGGIFLLFFDKKPNIRDSISMIAAISKWLVVVSVVPIVLRGDVIVYKLFTVIEGVDIAFKIDPFGLFFAFLASTLWIITTIYAVGYMRGLKEHAQTRFFFCFASSETRHQSHYLRRARQSGSSFTLHRPPKPSRRKTL